MANKTDLEGVYTEIMAGTAIFTKGERAEGWNAATERAVEIVKKYMRGEGLFQKYPEESEKPPR